MNSFLNIFSGLLQTQDKFLFRDEKINTVIVVITVIWLGIITYLLISGKKLKKLENELADLKNKTSGSSREPINSIEVENNRS